LNWYRVSDVVASKTRAVIDDICRQVDEGVLLPGDRLPSGAELRRQYGVSITVVRGAVQWFKAVGWWREWRGLGSTHLAFSGRDGQADVCLPVRRNHPTVGQYLARVIEEDHAVAQQAPPLLRVEGDGVGGATVRSVSWRARGPVWTHCAPPGSVVANLCVVSVCLGYLY
jgi:DNA-binding transcriptional regulator YhcF (GntR family)